MQTHYGQAVRVTTGLLGILAMTAAAPTRPQAQAGVSAIVAFGDSLTDTGNAFAVTREPGVPPDFGLDPFLLPSTAYARGGHHLSNGATWIEQLARPLGLVRSVQPALRSQSPFALNFSVATARARTTLANPGFDLLVATFLQKTGNVAPSDALYVIELGGHDVRDALAVSLGGGDPVPVLHAAVDAIGDNIRRLYAAGARNFLVWTVPDIGLIPAVLAIPGASPVATFWTAAFNGLLAVELAAISAELPGIHVIPFDAFGLIKGIVEQPAQFGLTDVTHACITPNAPPFFCQNPDEFLFWDGIHPTKAGHAIIAQAVAQLLGLD